MWPLGERPQLSTEVIFQGPKRPRGRLEPLSSLQRVPAARSPQRLHAPPFLPLESAERFGILGGKLDGGDNALGAATVLAWPLRLCPLAERTVSFGPEIKPSCGAVSWISWP